jgi:putative flippase GtrA
MKELFKKYREIIVYIIVGLMTTVVAYGVRFAVLYPFSALLDIPLDAESHEADLLRTIAVSLGWVAGVIFGFFTNKKWVFLDKVSETGAVWAQFGKFVGSRLFTYFVELGIGVLMPKALLALGYVAFKFIITVDADLLTTAVSMVVVTVLNYILSKLLVFRKKKAE